MRVFVDTSVIIASLLSPSGGSTRVINYIRLGKIKGVISQSVMNELLVEKKYKKFKKSKEELEKFIVESGLLVRKHISSEELTQYENRIDTEDAHIIAGAVLTKCTHLVTLDKRHFLRPDIQMKFLPLRIVSPKEILEEILEIKK